MDFNLFWTVLVAVLFGHLLHTAFMMLLFIIRKKKQMKKSEELSAIYHQAAKYAAAGNSEACEMMASRYKELSGRTMPPIVMVAQDEFPEEF